MPIQSDSGLSEATASAGTLLQDIHDYCGHSNRQDAKVRFPRGVLRTAEYYREQCPQYVDKKSSCAYAFMHLDLLWWLVARTDIDLVAREMTLKSAIITLGSILEELLTIPGEGIFHSKSSAGVKAKLDKAFDNGWIDGGDRDALKGLWERRCHVHLKKLPGPELGIYLPEHVNEPRSALGRLMASLKSSHGPDSTG